MAEQDSNLRLVRRFNPKANNAHALPTELPAKERPGLSTGTHRGVKNRIRAAVNTLIELCIPIDMQDKLTPTRRVVKQISVWTLRFIRLLSRAVSRL